MAENCPKQQKALSFAIYILGTISAAILFHFFQNTDFSGFPKLINKCQKEIQSCAPSSSHVCDFLSILYFSQNDSPSKTMKNVFYFIEKALSVLKIFKFLYFRLPLIFSLSAIVLEVDPRKILKFMMTSTV